MLDPRPRTMCWTLMALALATGFSLAAEIELQQPKAAIAWSDCSLAREAPSKLKLSGSLEVTGTLRVSGTGSVRLGTAGGHQILYSGNTTKLEGLTIIEGDLQLPDAAGLPLSHGAAKLSFGPNGDSALSRAGTGVLKVDGSLTINGQLTQSPYSFDLSYPSHTNNYPIGTAIIPESPSLSGASPPSGDKVVYRLAGELPPGITLDPITGVISGTPTPRVQIRPYQAKVYCFGPGNVFAFASLDFPVKLWATVGFRYDASQSTIATTGSDITSISDMSAGRILQWISSSGSKATYNTRWMNGVSVPALTGRAAYSTSGALSVGGPFTTCIVVKFSDSPNCVLTEIFALASPSDYTSGGNILVFKNGAQIIFRLYDASAATDRGTFSTLNNDGDNNYICLTYDGSVVSGYLNGVLENTALGFVLPAASQYATIGSRISGGPGDATGCNNFAVAEWVWFTSLLSQPAFAQLHEYLYNKWH